MKDELRLPKPVLPCAMKIFDVVWRKGSTQFSDINVRAIDADAAVAVVKAKNGWMFEALVSVTEFIPPAPWELSGQTPPQWAKS